MFGNGLLQKITTLSILLLCKTSEQLVNNRLPDHLEKCFFLISSMVSGLQLTANLLIVVSNRTARAF